jgi:hypothetical protein
MGKNEVELYGVGAGISPASASVARTRQSSAASGQSTHGIDTAWRRDEQISPFGGEEVIPRFTRIFYVQCL